MTKKYGFLLTIDNLDKRGDVIGTIRGAGSILDLVEGRDPEPSDPTVFNRFVLKPSLIAGGAELDCVAWVGINAGVPAVVRNEYAQNSALWRTIDFAGGTFDRAYMQQRILLEARNNQVTDGWVIIPGNVLTGGDLLAHFVPII